MDDDDRIKSIMALSIFIGAVVILSVILHIDNTIMLEELCIETHTETYISDGGAKIFSPDAELDCDSNLAIYELDDGRKSVHGCLYLEKDGSCHGMGKMCNVTYRKNICRD